MSNTLIRLTEVQRRTGYKRHGFIALWGKVNFLHQLKLARELLLSLRVKLTSGLISVLRNHAEQLPD